MRTEEDRVIERYRQELLVEAELAKGDLEEIEDHLRLLSQELQQQGVPRAEAIAEACRRLGEPRQLAREHARVRAPFGAQLSRVRAWGAVALMAPFLVHYGVHVTSVWSPPGLECALRAVVLAAVLARVTWARAILFGSLIPMMVMMGVWAVMAPSPVAVLEVVAYAAAFALVMPWRRGELTQSGVALALLSPTYGAAITSVMMFMTAPGGVVLANPFGSLALVMVIAAAGGVIMRARWAALAALIAGYALVMFTREIWDMTYRFEHARLMTTVFLGTFLVGAVTAVPAAILAWRGARSTTGTLRYVLR